MKKLIALAIAAIMVLSMIPAMALSASAVEETDWSLYPEPADGPWSVYRGPGDYDIDLNAGDTYTPAPGYKYTSEGFTLIPADYTNMTPFFTVQTSNPVDLTQGFYMQFRIDEFAYKGEDLSKPADEWICLNIADTRLMVPGNTEWNNNWFSLIRGAGDGSASFESAVTTKTTDGANGKVDFIGSVAGTAPMDEDGREIYELEITYDGTNYDILICGISIMSLQGSDKVQAALAGYEESYVGITVQTGVKDSTVGLTILKMGTSKADATTPEGTDEAEPEDNILVFGDPVDPATVPANEPALLFNAEKLTFKKDPEGSNIHFSATANNTYHVAATANGCFFNWHIKNDLTYMADDFGVFAMLLKDYMGNDSSLYYCAGDILAASPSHVTSWSLYDDNAKSYGADDEYTLVVVDLGALNTDEEKMWTGRINALRPDFSVDASDEEWAEWDIEYMGVFRSVEEAHAYGDKYMEGKDIETKGEEETQAPTDPADEETQAPTTDNGGEGETKDNAGEGETSGTTNAPTTGGDNAGDKDEGGCASVIGISAIVLMAAAAAVVLKKKD